MITPSQVRSILLLLFVGFVLANMVVIRSVGQSNTPEISVVSDSTWGDVPSERQYETRDLGNIRASDSGSDQSLGSSGGELPFSQMQKEESEEMAARGAWIEQLSWKPRAYLYHNFMTKEEAQYIINAAAPLVQRSTVVDSETGKSIVDPIRTSHHTFLQRQKYEGLTKIEERLARWAGLPYENGEDMQVLRYEYGQTYRDHQDVAELGTQSGYELSKDGGYRVATALLYLSDVEEGGETVFPDSEWLDPTNADRNGPWSDCGGRGVAAKPRIGDVLLFYSVDWDHTIDPHSTHAGCPVIRGTKWTATKWMHEKPFRFEFLSGQRPQAPRGCGDFDINCPEWAKSGECEGNPEYMRSECAKSCKAC